VSPNVPEILADVTDAYNEVEDAFPDFKDMPDGTDSEYVHLAEAATMIAAVGAATDSLSFTQLATIGFFDVVAQDDDAQLRQAIVDFAGFLVKWVEEIDRRQPAKPAEPKAIAA